MSLEEVLERANQGDPQAIASVISESTLAHGVIVRVARQGEALYVLLESGQPPDQNLMVALVSQGLLRLHTFSVQAVRIYWRRLGEKVADWNREVKQEELAHYAATVEAEPLGERVDDAEFLLMTDPGEPAVESDPIPLVDSSVTLPLGEELPGSEAGEADLNLSESEELMADPPIALNVLDSEVVAESPQDLPAPDLEIALEQTSQRGQPEDEILADLVDAEPAFSLEEGLEAPSLDCDQPELSLENALETSDLDVDEPELSLEDVLEASDLDVDEPELSLEDVLEASDLSVDEPELSLEDVLEASDLDVDEPELSLEDVLEASDLSVDEPGLSLEDALEEGLEAPSLDFDQPEISLANALVDTLEQPGFDVYEPECSPEDSLMDALEEPELDVYEPERSNSAPDSWDTEMASPSLNLDDRLADFLGSAELSIDSSEILPEDGFTETLEQPALNLDRWESDLLAEPELIPQAGDDASEAMAIPPGAEIAAIPEIQEPVTSLATVPEAPAIPREVQVVDAESEENALTAGHPSGSSVREVLRKPESLLMLVMAVFLIFWQAYLEILAEVDNADAGSLSGRTLARRLKVNSSTVSRRKEREDFGEWSRSLDPDGIAWICRPDGRFVPR
ncbi:hypothetical protein BST81_00500 [Leptolyngbya sp. 'hensonii']|uniref:hypothetical protein n=1 Tax=Leptolyngbya sp. 'hensonii' TaxID=1922337 RepID=UPI00094F60D9|nr:hypothetical protein [Leptolyngbya sp. 'hensonii']OLP20259.1 hypothetical protein BST81_00500 [Leptolyngbya sp. 'hensonii']